MNLTVNTFDTIHPHMPLHHWLKDLPAPTGLFVVNDTTALDVLNICVDIDIRVPEQLAVLGCDGLDWLGQLATPPLSSIRVSGETTGYRAAELLDAMLEGRCDAPPDHVIDPTPPGIVLRQSSDILAIDVPALAEALRFIREQAQERVNVADIVQAAGVNRRQLERLFRQHLRCTPLEKLTRERVNIACQLLSRTESSMTEIARRCGFRDAVHLAKVFQTEQGCPPTEYRRKVRHRAMVEPN